MKTRKDIDKDMKIALITTAVGCLIVIINCLNAVVSKVSMTSHENITFNITIIGTSMLFCTITSIKSITTLIKKVGKQYGI